MLFQFVGEFLYQGDMPLGERKLAALSLDLDLMEQLLGPSALREVLDPAALAAVESELQHTAPGWRKHDAEGIADLLRELGPLTVAEIAARVDDGVQEPAVSELLGSRRAFSCVVDGVAYLAQSEDAGTIAALGIEVPAGLAADFPARVDPLHDLVLRYARTHTEVTASGLAARFGVTPADAADVLQALAGEGRVREGAFGSDALVWMDVEVLERIRRRSLAIARQAIQPVDQAQYVRFLLRWQYCGRVLTDSEGLVEAIEQLCALPLVASTLETMILPQRVANYTPALLDGLLGAGDVCWVGEGRTGGEGRISLHLRDGIALTLDPVPALAREDRPEGENRGNETGWNEKRQNEKELWIVRQLAGGGAIFGSELLAAAHQEFPELTAADFADHLWELAWGGIVTSDSLAALRSVISGRSSAQKTQRARPRSQRTRRSSFVSMRQAALASQDPRLAGRWSLVPRAVGSQNVSDASQGQGVQLGDEQSGGVHSVGPGPSRRDNTLAEAERMSASLGLLLDRYGVVSRGSVMAEGYPGGFAAVYDGLAQLEAAGYCRRGHFVEGISGAQFATSEAVNALRDDGEDEAAVVLSAVDPANPFGAAIPWPETADPEGAKPRRNAGALLAIYRGKPAFYLERGGKTALTFDLADGVDLPDDEDLAGEANLEEARRQIAAALVDTCRRGRIDDFVLDSVDGERSTRSAWGPALKEAGFSVTPRGLSYTRPAW